MGAGWFKHGYSDNVYGDDTLGRTRHVVVCIMLALIIRCIALAAIEYNAPVALSDIIPDEEYGSLQIGTREELFTSLNLRVAKLSDDRLAQLRGLFEDARATKCLFDRAQNGSQDRQIVLIYNYAYRSMLFSIFDGGYIVATSLGANSRNTTYKLVGGERNPFFERLKACLFEAI